MPTYNFRNKNTGEEWEEFFTISGKEDFLKENSHIEQTISSITLVSTRYTKPKPSEGFKDILRTIKARNKGSTIDI